MSDNESLDDRKFSQILKDKFLDTLSRKEKEAFKQELRQLSAEEKKAQIAALNAQTLQEEAIARRIENAHYIHIEEYYEYQGDGNVRLQVNNNGTNLGLSGSGSKITKRVIELKGFKDDQPT